jgi:V/A-type H+-transporting ATPase subunit I
VTIVPLKRVTIIGPSGDKAATVASLQEIGCLHLVPLKQVGPLEPADAGPRRRAASAWRHLTGAPRLLRPLQSLIDADFEEIIERALANKERLRVSRDHKDFLKERIESLSVLGDFALPSETDLLGRKLWFYVLPVKDRRALDAVSAPWQIVGRDPTRLHVALITPDEPQPDILPVPRLHSGVRQLSALRDDLEAMEIEIERAEDELAELSRYRVALGLRLARAQDRDAREHAARTAHDEGRLFALQGWAPSAEVPCLIDFAEQMGLAVSFEDPGPDDLPPTLLDNPGAFEGAGPLTSFYMTPSYRSWDPSLIVFFSFALFFAMILADAGYAAVLGAGLLAYWKKLGHSAQSQRIRTMLAVVFGTSFTYGVLAGSYFGVAPPEGSLPASLALIDIGNFQVMMRVSVTIGVLHISLANLQVAWRNRDRVGIVMAKLGWVAVAFGGLFLWLVPSPLWYVLIVGGLVAVFVGSGLERRIEMPSDWMKRLADGALGLTNVTKIFGDILSYMRLFALGLASASLAATFNLLAHDLAQSMPGVGVLLAIMVLLFGHAINLAMGILSGVVHGLRLNFIEFFNWGLSDEGYPFKAFARRETAT